MPAAQGLAPGGDPAAYIRLEKLMLNLLFSPLPADITARFPRGD